MINPIAAFGVETCALVTLLYFGIGWCMGLSDFRHSEKERELKPEEIVIATVCYGMRDALLMTAAAWIGLFLAAYLTSQIELHIIWDLCANQPISCVQVGRVL